MELNTFGALLKFALALEDAAVRFYEEGAEASQTEPLRGTLAALAQAGKRNRQRLERVRREHVNEMLLESVEGLKAGDYQVGAPVPSGACDGELRSSAVSLEAVAERFYREAADRLSIPEVVRSFLRLADGHARTGNQLKGVPQDGCSE